MKVLVTGHLGYLGRVLTPMLESRGHVVAGMDTAYFSELADRNNQKLQRLDVRQAAMTQLQGVDAIAHLAALSNDPMGQLDPSLTDDINHKATVHLAELARRAGVRKFAFSSSCSIYGAADTSRPLDETAPFAPVTAYAKSKRDSEAGLSALSGESFSPVFLRNATAFGLSPAMRFDLVVNNLVGWALTTGKIVMQSDGTPWRPLVHVEDIAMAFTAAIEAPQETVHCEAFNIGRDDQNFQVRQIAEVVRMAVPGCTVELATGASPDKRSYRVSFAKAANKLPGFKPLWTVETGVRQMVDYFKKHGLTLEEFRGRRYVRLEQIKYLVDSAQVDRKLFWTQKVRG